GRTGRGLCRRAVSQLHPPRGSLGVVAVAGLGGMPGVVEFHEAGQDFLALPRTCPLSGADDLFGFAQIGLGPVEFTRAGSSAAERGEKTAQAQGTCALEDSPSLLLRAGRQLYSSPVLALRTRHPTP